MTSIHAVWAITVAVLLLGVAPLLRAQCTNDAGTGDLPEGEPCVTSLADNTDDGCNFAPNLFFELGPGDFAGDGSVRLCGRGSNFDGPGAPPTPCNGNGECTSPPNLCLGGFCAVNRRDTDWYRISLAALQAADLDG